MSGSNTSRSRGTIRRLNRRDRSRRPKGNMAPSLTIPENWSFQSGDVAKAFDQHVRISLPWYDFVTGAVAHFARAYIPADGVVVDVGASTGNIGRALAPTLKQRGADFRPIDNSPDMVAVYDGPGLLEIIDATAYDFESPPRPDLIICFLSLMFVPVGKRGELIERMKSALNPGGALLVVDKMIPRPGYVGTVAYRLTLAAKHEAGATANEIIAKELSISGVQRPMSESELPGFVEFFRFGDFAGFVWEKQAVEL